MLSNRRVTCLIAALAAITLGICACGRKDTATTAGDGRGNGTQPTVAPDATYITYFGQGAFLLADKEVRIVIAPHDDRVGYGMDKPEADVVLIGDSKAAREQAKIISGRPKIIDRPGEHEVKGVKFRAIESATSAPGGGTEKDMIYCFELRGVKYCHLGGLSKALTADQVKAIGPVNVLMVPVGGGYTLDPKQAWATIAQLKATFVLPTHFKTEKTKDALGLETAQPFLDMADETDASGQPKGLVNRGAHSLTMSPRGVPPGPTPVVYVAKPW